MVSSSFFCFSHCCLLSSFFLLAPEKLIEGLKSPEPALLLPELLPLADPFGSTADPANAAVAVESLIPGLEAPLAQRLVSHSDSVASNRTDSLTGEDSLLDCSLLSNPAADLLDEFAPVAFAAQPHKGKLCSQPWPSASQAQLL
uniref:Uncharacterized protein n=1 Tax=Geospiza parvula TaxID=87175 RepID=A0A8C3MR90_GEOPR